MKKGFYFSFDALVALSVLGLATVMLLGTSAPARNSAGETVQAFRSTNTLAEDAVQVSARSSLRQAFAAADVDRYVNETNLTDDDADKSVMDVIALLWASNETRTAANISRDFFDDLFPAGYGYRITVEGDGTTLIYNSSIRNGSEAVATARRLVSGIEKDRPQDGYLARARATEADKNTTEVFEIPPSGSAPRGGNSHALELNRTFELDAEQIQNATLFLSMRTGGSDPNSIDVEVNGDDAGFPNTWDYEVDKDGNKLLFHKEQVTSLLETGWNSVFVSAKNTGGNSDVDEAVQLNPGSRVEVTYSPADTELVSADPVTAGERNVTYSIRFTIQEGSSTIGNSLGSVETDIDSSHDFFSNTTIDDLELAGVDKDGDGTIDNEFTSGVDEWQVKEGGSRLKIGFSGSGYTNTEANDTIYIDFGDGTNPDAGAYPVRVQTSGDGNWQDGTLDIGAEFADTGLSSTFTERNYFTNIETEGHQNTGHGVWSVMSYYVPDSANVTNVTLNLHALDVDEVGDRNETQVYLNDKLVNATSLCTAQGQGQGQCDGEQRVAFRYNLTNLTDPGTNVVAVYVDTFLNETDSITGFGDDDRIELYAEPKTEPANSSYLEYTYERSRTDLVFGKIALSRTERFGGNRTNPKPYNVTFDGNVSRLSTFVHLAQLDSRNVTVTVDNGTEQTVFVSPRESATPNDIFIAPDRYDATEGVNNTVTVSDECTNKCDILPETTFERRLLLTSQVPYGATFQNRSAAQRDAEERLNETLGAFVDVTKIDSSTLSVNDVPWLFGPVTFEMEVWKK